MSYELTPIMATGGSPTHAPPVSQEQALLESFFSCLSQFAYDKAKELMEKERDGHKATFGSSWGLLMHSMANMAMNEKTYTSLVYLSPKWFGRKDVFQNMRSSYTILLTELKRIEEIPGTQADPELVAPPPSSEKLLSHLCGQLGHFVTARIKMMDFYEQMSTMGSMKVINFDDLLNVIAHISQNHQKNFHHPILSPLKTSFTLECDINSHLLQAQKNMANWQFLTSLLQLHEAHTKLAIWCDVTQMKDTPAVPALYHWLNKFKGVLVSKFSLYFYDTLSKQAPQGEMKSVMAKATVDFISRITTFQKKSDAVNISLVFDVHGIEDLYNGPGYHHPNKFSEKPKGLDSYPAVFAYPGEKPSNHWPNVIMIMEDRRSENTFDKVIFFYDKKMQSTYFMSRIEPRITLVLIFETKKAEKDSYIVNFVNEFSTLLRLNKTFQTLKQGAK
ncbi:KICSTOR subunit 2-like isoform X2 [Lineus longissimus]|uniref:KICSTOR subunit 2-like isoform X2 n=1 Tax=Lineus longissimus TaxID=88925 RepID=UPI00315CEA1C